MKRKLKQKQSRIRLCLQNRMQNTENSNACAPITSVSRSGTQSTHILERIRDKTAGKRPAGTAGAAGAAGTAEAAARAAGGAVWAAGGAAC